MAEHKLVYSIDEMQKLLLSPNTEMQLEELLQ